MYPSAVAPLQIPRGPWGSLPPTLVASARHSNGSPLLNLIQQASNTSRRGRNDVNAWQAVLDRLDRYPAEVIITDRRGRGPLSVLAAAHHANAAAALPVLCRLQRMLRPGSATQRDKTGQTALLIALQQQQQQRPSFAFLQGLLATQGAAQVGTPNHQGNLPLHVALEYNRSSRASTLLWLDANPVQRQPLVEILLLQHQPHHRQASASSAAWWLTHENHAGMTPLHVALQSRLPDDIVIYLAKAGPVALSRRACGFTPLMAAVEASYSLAAIRALVALDPSTTRLPDENGKYPLRRCLELRRHDRALIALLCTCPAAVDGVDLFGRNAVQLVLEQWYSSTALMDPGILALLFAQSPGAAQPGPPREAPFCGCPTRRRRQASHFPRAMEQAAAPIVLCYKPYQVAEVSLARAAAVPKEQHRPRPMTTSETAAQLYSQRTQLVTQWWQTSRVVLQALHPNLLAAALRTAAPMSIIQRVLDDSPEWIHQSIPVDDDDQDNTDDQPSRRRRLLPLHWICQPPRAVAVQHPQPAGVLEVLLAAAPEHAGVPAITGGPLALHMCVSNSNSVTLGSPALLTRLVQAHPPALRQSWAGSYPFVLAAVAASTDISNNDSHNTEDDALRQAQQVEHIFTLLSLAPGLLRACVAEERERHRL